MNGFFKITILLLTWGWACLSSSFAQSTPAIDEQVIAETVPPADYLAYEQMARFTLAMEQIHEQYVKAGQDVSYDTLIDGAIRGMMSNLDAYSEYMASDTLKSLQETTQENFGGVGIVINQLGPWITVVSPIEDSPGWEAGVMAGDQIRAIEGVSAKGMGMSDVVTQLRGTPGTEVTVEFWRPSENRGFEVSLTRSVIETPSVSDAIMLEEGIGYVRVKTFSEKTAELLRREMTRLKRQHAQGLVLDLRGNPGGLLTAAVEVAGLFLPQGSLVVYTQGREGQERRDFYSRLNPHRLNPRLVILINEGSASAAEIVSGALQDYDRAVLVGQTSFGKASVQSIVPLPDGSALKLTTASYFTPTDRQIHERGIPPDVEVVLPLRVWYRLQNGIEEGNWENDPQVMKAVELLRSEISDETEG
ncbi:S41 family peptidase [Kiritimatiellota bacterium B12222]|nr:S41 family peptidase [Kiritimatiellota bacterium B12222]